MGFEGMAALTHQMEDVFELLRQRAAASTATRSTSCSSASTRSTRPSTRIEADGAERLEPAPLIERLKGLVRDRTPLGRRPPMAARPLRRCRTRWPTRWSRARRCCTRGTLDRRHADAPVRAYMVIAAAAELGRVVASAPEVDHVEAFDGRVVDLWITAEVEAATLSAALLSVPDVATAEVTAEAGDGEPDTAADVAAAPVAMTERPDASRAAPTVRVDAERLDQLMHLMGELVVQRTQVEVLAAQAEVPGLSQAMQDLTRCSHALQAIVMQVRMIACRRPATRPRSCTPPRPTTSAAT